jgi:hypothetical protein
LGHGRILSKNPEIINCVINFLEQVKKKNFSGQGSALKRPALNAGLPDFSGPGSSRKPAFWI